MYNFDPFACNIFYGSCSVRTPLFDLSLQLPSPAHRHGPDRRHYSPRVRRRRSSGGDSLSFFEMDCSSSGDLQHVPLSLLLCIFYIDTFMQVSTKRNSVFARKPFVSKTKVITRPSKTHYAYGTVNDLEPVVISKSRKSPDAGNRINNASKTSMTTLPRMEYVGKSKQTQGWKTEDRGNSKRRCRDGKIRERLH